MALGPVYIYTVQRTPVVVVVVVFGTEFDGVLHSGSGWAYGRQSLYVLTIVFLDGKRKRKKRTRDAGPDLTNAGAHQTDAPSSFSFLFMHNELFPSLS